MELCRTFLLAPLMLSNCCYPVASSIQKVVKVTTRLIIHPNTCLKFTIFPHDDISDLKMHCYVDDLAPPLIHIQLMQIIPKCPCYWFNEIIWRYLLRN